MNIAKTKCPVCRKPANKDFFPFCSRLCAKLDLKSWLNEDYRIKIDENDKDAAIDKIPDNQDDE